MPPLEPPDCSDIPMPAPAKIPPIILAASASWIRGVDGIGIKLKNSVWLNTHTSVRKKNCLPIQINANANNGMFNTRLITPAISVVPENQCRYRTNTVRIS